MSRPETPSVTEKENTTRVIPAGMFGAFALVTGLFALWGFANDITNPLVAAFKEVFLINHSQSMLVQTAFYGGYCIMAIPAALFLRRFSYKRSILVGLGLYALGCFLFFPAAKTVSFEFFLFAYFVMTCGLSFLETTANPYILSLGPQETATRRLNFAQAFNPIGSLAGMAVATAFILAALNNQTETNLKTLDNLGNKLIDVEVAKNISGNAEKAAQKTPEKSTEIKNAASAKLALTAAKKAEKIRNEYKEVIPGSANAPKESKSETVRQALHDYNGKSSPNWRKTQDADLTIIVRPYLILGIVVAAVFALFSIQKIPDATRNTPQTINSPNLSIGATLRRLFTNGAYVQGVIAQAVYVGVQIMCWTSIIQYAGKELGMLKDTAQTYNIVAMAVFVSSRFVCTFLMKFVSPGGLLSFLAASGGLFVLGAMFLSNGYAAPDEKFNLLLLFTNGYWGLLSLLLVSACMSLMFPTIYGITLRDVSNEDAKLGSAGLILAIGGGAIFPWLQGKIMDQSEFFSQNSILGLDSLRASFVLAFLCFFLIFVYGLRTKLVHHAVKS
ncbi:MAG: MFS transporter [Puniceicoccales bacterium]|jgi:FHS family L-fucose permease-like MFS transporter|nr:MFS transporter [Puniceicoccales bacterium]